MPRSPLETIEMAVSGLCSPGPADQPVEAALPFPFLADCGSSYAAGPCLPGAGTISKKRWWPALVVTMKSVVDRQTKEWFEPCCLNEAGVLLAFAMTTLG